MTRVEEYAGYCGPRALARVLDCSPRVTAATLLTVRKILTPHEWLSRGYYTRPAELLAVLDAWPGCIVTAYDVATGEPLRDAAEPDPSLPADVREAVQAALAERARSWTEKNLATLPPAPRAMSVREWLAGPGRGGRWLLFVRVAPGELGESHVMAADGGRLAPGAEAWPGRYAHEELLLAWQVRRLPSLQA
jgi:hypothetical protein